MENFTFGARNSVPQVSELKYGKVHLSGKKLCAPNLQAKVWKISYFHILQTKFKNRDFPGGPVVKNSLSNAGDKSSVPGWGAKIPHVQSNQACSPQKKEPVRSKWRIRKQESDCGYPAFPREVRSLLSWTRWEIIV